MTYNTKVIRTPLIWDWEKKKEEKVTKTERLYCFYYFPPMFSVVAIPATDMTKSENSETCLVHWYINPTFVSRTAGFAHQKGSEDREGILWRRNMGSIGAGAALRVLLLYRNLQCSCLAQEQRKGDYQVGLLSLCDPN